MNFGLFRKIIDECGPYIYELSLFNWGEPLLNKEIFKMIRYAKKFKIKVIISTNLKKFDGVICSELVQSGVDVVIVSLDGASQQSVSKYQTGNDFEKIIANMEKLVGYKKQLNTAIPSVQWRYLVNSCNEHEIDKARLISKKIGIDELSLNKFRCDMGSELLLNNKEQFANVKKWLPQNESLSMYDYSREEKKKNKLNHCRWLWFQSSINWNGSVSPCCAVWDEKFDFGNLSDNRFAEIWNSAKYREARKIVRGDNIQSTDNICAICHSNKAII